MKLEHLEDEDKLQSDGGTCEKMTNDREGDEGEVAPPQPGRGNWENPFDFFVSCLGYAVGLGNFWRFPMLCFQYGGGSFLIPYTIMLFGAGLPMLFLEFLLGQYAAVGPIHIFGRISPFFKGLGYALVFAAAFLAFFYNVVVGWSLWYFITSISSLPLDWLSCDHDYNTNQCFSIFQEETECNGTSIFYNRTCVNADVVCTKFGLDASEMVAGQCVNDSGVLIPPKLLLDRTSTSVDEFFSRNVLGVLPEYDWSNFGYPRWQSLCSLFFAWFCVAICLLKGVKTTGKAVYVTTFFPYIILIILGIRGFTLPGAGDGILAYLTPKWSTLASLDIWVDASTQIIFSLGPACGCLLTLSSYSKFTRNCHRDAIFIAITNSLTSFFCGFVVFSILGFMAHEAGVPVLEVAKGGPGLAFIVYPEIVNKLGSGGVGANIFSALFFLMLVTLALGSVFGAFETIMASFCDHFVGLRNSKPVMVTALALVFFIMGIPFTCPAGIHMFTLFNASAPSWNLLLFALLEVVIVAWIFGADKFLNLTMSMGMTLGKWTRLYWIITWRFITPTVLSTLLIMAWASFGRVAYGGYTYPTSIQILGYLITGCTLIWIPVFAIIESRKAARDNRNVFHPTEKWDFNANQNEITDLQLATVPFLQGNQEA